MIKIFQDNLIFKNREFPRTILGYAPFTSEGYFGHRTRLYELDLKRNPQNIANIIKKSWEIGVRGINLVNDDSLLEAYDLTLKDDVDMDILATIGHSNIDYVFPNYEKAKKVNWKEDIEVLSNYNCSMILIDEFLVDSYDWDFIINILDEINDTGLSPGLISSFPFKTTEELLKSPLVEDKDLFDFYMVPINKLAYMMDCPFFLDENRGQLKNLLTKLNKKIIVNKILAAGIQMPSEAFNFLKTLDFVDMLTVGVASTKEADETFTTLRDI